MAQCPNCDSELLIPEQNFGTLFTCPQCEAVFFVDWNGQPENSSNSISAQPEIPSLEGQEVEEHKVLENEIFEGLEGSSVSFESENRQSNQEDLPVFEEPMATNLLSDVEAYGNNIEGSSVPLSYTVIIDKIDSNELFQELRDALNDSRLGWNFDVITKDMSDGRLVLSDLNPATAAEVVRRIKGLKLEIAWSQNVFQG